MKQLEVAAVVFPAARAEEMEEGTNNAHFASWPEEPTPWTVMSVTSQGSDHQPQECFDTVDGPDQDLSLIGNNQTLPCNPREEAPAPHSVNTAHVWDLSRAQQATQVSYTT